MFTVAFGQPASVRVATSGGESDDPYIAVRVGECLTYVYDRDALDSHVSAWREAGQHAAKRTLAEVHRNPQRQDGQEIAMSVTTRGVQPFTVGTDETPAGLPVLSVQVGSVTVRITSTAALLSYLSAWNRARTLAAVFDESELLGDLSIDQIL